MANITLSIPDDLKKEMDLHEEIRWSSVVRSIIEDRMERLRETNRLASQSRLTLKNVEALTSNVNEDLRRHVRERYDETGRRR